MSRKTGDRWRENHPEEWRAYQSRYRLENRARLMNYGVAYRRTAKIDAVKHYSKGSMACACCGEAELDFLTIDHINGGGNKERKTTGRGGQSFAIWLRKNGFPSGFQILCYNCNCAKAFCKVCPHERVKHVAIV